MFLTRRFAEKYQNLLMMILSGVLIAIASGFIPDSNLEFLAWAGFVPLLLALKKVNNFKRYFLYTYSTFLLFFLLTIYSFFDAFFFGGTVILFIGALHFCIPILSLFFIQKKTGWRKSLILLPFIWTIWEYYFIQSKFSVAILSIAVSQAPYTWLIQFVDIFGSGAITFWLVLLNVLIVFAIADWFTTNYKTLQSYFTKYISLIILMFLIPLLYSFYVFNSSKFKNDNGITVSLIQPNIDPKKKWGDSEKAAAIEKTINLTDSLIQTKKTELIIWPEAAVPYVILQEEKIRNKVFDAVKKWNTSLLTGTIDIKYFSDPRTVSPLPKYLNRNYELYNCALLITPQLAAIAGEPGFESLNIKSYKKQNLMPFTEQVPFSEKYPVLSNLALDFGGGANWSAGSGPKTLLFADKNERRVKISPAICWDILYPETIIESAKNGAEFLAFITNEGWFGKSITAHEIEGFTRLRSIETRRSIAKCGNTGYTFFTDIYGNICGKIDWWEENFTTEKVKLSSSKTIYMMYPSYFPIACFIITTILFIYFVKKKNNAKMFQIKRNSS